MKRLDQIVLIGTFIGFSWLAMQAVHELGHMLGAILTGGNVTAVALHPQTIYGMDWAPASAWVTPEDKSAAPRLSLPLPFLRS